MGVMLDIVLSMALRGAIVIAVLNMTVALQSKLSEKTVQSNIFGEVTIVARIMTDDFRSVGYNVSGTAFTVATSDTIGFYVSPTVNVKYFAGSVSELSGPFGTPNPKDRRLYKYVNGVVSPVVNGVDSLSFTYFDVNGQPPASLDKIKSFSVYLVMGSGDMVNSIYPTSEWTYRFFPPNIN